MTHVYAGLPALTSLISMSSLTTVLVYTTKKTPLQVYKQYEIYAQCALPPWEPNL